MPPRIARVLVATCLLAASAVVTLAELSDKIRAAIVEPLPKFVVPPASPTPAPTAVPAPLSNDPLVKLPDYHIKERRLPDHDPDQWLSQRAIDHQAMSDYSGSMTDLEWALNCWYIPFVTPSPQARANARYAEKKLIEERKRMNSIIRAVEQVDPAEAKKLLRDLDFSRHPGQ